MLHLRKIKLIFISVLTGFSVSLSQTSFSGDLNFYYLSALNDNHLVNLPYRMIDIQIQHQYENMEIFGNLAMEYSPQKHTHFLSNSNPQDFLWDLRELYMAWYTDFGEVRLGKQIHTWGSVDENSPIDVVNAFDYYYLFFQGADRKLGSYSAAIDIYFNDWKLGAVLSPYHHTNRVPINDPEFPIRLPIVPQEHQIYPIEKVPIEYGAFIEYSHNYGDIRLSGFSGYDRLFNLSGINAFFQNESQTGSPDIDIVYGYRKTNMIGAGGTLLFEDLILRGDYAFFKTKDQNKRINRDNPNPSLGWLYTYLAEEYPLSEKADYYQMTLQFEYGLPWDITIVGQYFSYDTLNYKSGELPIDEDVDIPNLALSADEINPRNFFSPGMGTPIAALMKKALTLSLEKTFLEDQLKVSLLGMMDLYNPLDTKNTKFWGSILGLTIEYNLAQNLKLISGITQITGDNNHPDGEHYRLNQMEDFSHLRFELKYSF